jgi:hypothetical protein
MVYGVSTLLKARPAYIVYNVGQFNVPLSNELVADANTGTDHSLTVPSAPWTGPKLVGARLPKDIQENNKLIFSAVYGRGDVFDMPRYFVPYDDVKQEVIARARGVDQLAKELGQGRGLWPPALADSHYACPCRSRPQDGESARYRAHSARLLSPTCVIPPQTGSCLRRGQADGVRSIPVGLRFEPASREKQGQR